MINKIFDIGFRFLASAGIQAKDAKLKDVRFHANNIPFLSGINLAPSVIIMYKKTPEG